MRITPLKSYFAKTKLVCKFHYTTPLDVFQAIIAEVSYSERTYTRDMPVRRRNWSRKATTAASAELYG